MSETTSSPTLVHAGEADRLGGWQWSDPARGEHFRRCSYCGSMHPDDFVTIARGRVDWADRKYGWPHKFYVHVPNQNPDALFVISSSSGGNQSKPDGSGSGWVRVDDLTPEQEAVMAREGYGPGSRYRPTGWVLFGTRAEHFGKVYTVHLADPAISDETKAAAADMCGLRFEFTEGRRRIHWWGAS